MQGAGCRVQGPGSRVEGPGFRAQGSGLGAGGGVQEVGGAGTSSPYTLLVFCEKWVGQADMGEASPFLASRLLPDPPGGRNG